MALKSVDFTGKRFNAYILFLGLALFFYVFLKNAWVSEDAYISFRSLLQLFSGNGPVWNEGYRVQVYTSALWYWLLALYSLFIPDFFIASIVLSAICCLLMLLIIYFFVRNKIFFLLAILLMVLSPSFFDWTSAGQENALAFLLITALTALYINLCKDFKSGIQKGFLSGFYILLGLLALCRHDLVLIFLFPAIYILVRSTSLLQRRVLLKILLVSATPLLAWTIFSLIYYGYPFPNTAYAKLNTQFPESIFMDRGLLYLGAHFFQDSLFALIIVVSGLILVLVNRVYAYCLLLGLVLYIFYLVYIGGDYLYGRFVSWLYPISLMCLIAFIEEESRSLFRRSAAGVVIGLLIALVMIPDFVDRSFGPLSTSVNWGHKDYSPPGVFNNIFDARFGDFRYVSLWHYVTHHYHKSHTNHPGCEAGEEYGRTASSLVMKGIGMLGYCAGTQLKIIDMHGLTDPLISRTKVYSELPSEDPTAWMPGHLIKEIPEGYEESMTANTNAIADKQLHEYYDKVRIIVASRDLWSWERIVTIIHMNMGDYNYLLNDANHRHNT